MRADLLDKPYFYTLQEHLPTRRKQLEAWAALTLAHFQREGVREFSRGRMEADDFALFNNAQIRRRLNAEFVRLLLQELKTAGKIEFRDAAEDVFFVYTHNVEELAEAIHKWARDSGRTNRIETLLFLAGDEETKGQIFWGYPVEVLLKAARFLAAKGRADVIELEERSSAAKMGVKFKA